MTKVLLINPPETFQEDFTNPPLGLLYLAGTLREHGVDVKIVDACLLGWDVIIPTLKEYQPDIVGITSLTPGRKKAIQVAEMAKEADSRILVVMGGAHPTIMYKQILENYPAVDVIVRGEGEFTLLEIAQGKPWPEIDGICYRSSSGIIKNKDRKFVENLDEILLPAWDLIDLSKYPARGNGVVNGINLAAEPRVSVIFSRGCTGNCEFCSTWWIWKGYRCRSAKNMVDELELLNKNHGIKHICFADDAFSVNRKKTIELCQEIIKRKLNIAFQVTTRVDCVDPEMLDLLKQAGCYLIAYGIETSSQELLDEIKKKTDVETAKKALIMTREAGIGTSALLIVGNVGETRESINETIEFIWETQPSTIGCVGGLWILPGTALYQKSKRLGLIDDDFWLGDEPYMVYTAEHSLEEIQEFFNAVVTRQKIPVCTLPSSKQFQLNGRRGFNFLVIPDWPSDLPALNELVKDYIASFRTSEDVSLVLRADPSLGQDIGEIQTFLLNIISELGYEPEDIPDILLVDGIINSNAIDGLFLAVEAYVFLETRKDEVKINLANRLGTPLVDGRKFGNLRNFYENHMSKKPVSSDKNYKEKLMSTYEEMYERRRQINKDAFSMDYWRDHFCLRTALSSPVLKGHILDVGCGTGEIDIWLARYGRQVTGIDISPTAIKVAKEHLVNQAADVQQRVNFYEGLIEEMPFPAKSFDSCFMSEVLEHVEDPKPLFKSIARVLKDDGKVVITVPLDHAYDDPTHVHHFDSGESLRQYLTQYAQDVRVNVVENEQQIVAEIGKFNLDFEDANPKIVCMMRIKDEERWIAQSLTQTSKLVDAIVILDDGSTDRTPEICKSFPKVVKYEWQDISITDEVRDKNKLLQWALDLEADWILALDGDEVLEDIAPDAIQEAIDLCPPEVAKFEFEFLYLWDKETQYRIDGKYAGLFHPRMFRVKGQDLDKIHFYPTQYGANFHCGSLAQNIVGETLRLDIKVKHYGYFFKEQREEKYHWYCGKDPENAKAGYYEHLVDETGIQLRLWRERTETVVRKQFAKWFIGRGIFLLRNGNSNEALVKFSRAEEIVPDMPELKEMVRTVRDKISSKQFPLPGEASGKRGYYEKQRPEIVNLVPPTVRRVLDVGCASGVMGQFIKEKIPGCYVAGLEINAEAAKTARQKLDQVIEGDVEQLVLKFPKGYFDCIIFADVLEHLRDPWATLARLMEFLADGGTVIASLPNIRNYRIISSLIQGNWTYTAEGILDATHLRFFTLAEARKMFAGAGLAVEQIGFNPDDECQLPFPGDQLVHTVSSNMLEIKNLSRQDIQELSALQFLIKAQKGKPLADALPEKEYLASVIIPVYNKAGYTSQCLGAIAENSGFDNYEAIIVDNASTDGTKDFLRSLEGDIQIITNNENLGFVEACNQGAKVARGKYLIFLNNDTVPKPGWLTELIRVAENDPLVGAVGAKLIYPDGRLQEAGGIIWNDGTGWNYGRGDDPRKPQYNFVREVDYCSGACLLIARDLFEKIGGFDLRYAPAYYEDTDLCFAVRDLGYKVLYNPRAEIVHFEGTTAGTDLSSGMKRYQQINQQKFAEKWAKALAKQYSPGVNNVPRAATRNSGKNILVIDQFLPLYDRAAGSLRLFNILKLLRNAGHFITYVARDGRNQERYIDELERMGIEVYATDPEKIRAPGYGLLSLKIDLEQILTSKPYELAWLSFYDIAEQYLEEIRHYSPQTAVIIDTVDVHYLREERMAEISGDPKLMERAVQTKTRELAIYPGADLVITVTEDDRRVLQKEVFQLPVAVIPTIHDVLPETAPFEDREGLLFVGNFNHTPNLDAVNYFVSEIWPLVKVKVSELKFYIVGYGSDMLCKFDDQDIVVTGYVPDIQLYLQACRVSVAPLRYGAGMKGKIGEAMISGIPVVTTSIGSEGIGLVDGEHVLIANTPEEFADAVIRLYTAPDLWHKLVANGKNHIQQNFSAQAVAEKLADLLSSIELQQKSVETPPRPPALTSIVILTHNELEYTRQCVESILKYTREPYELIFVDNGSSDGTIEYLQSLSGARVIANPINLGFGTGCNQGMSVARGEYIVLLNNDTVVTEGWLNRMITRVESDPSVGMVGPRSNYVVGPQLVNPVPYADDLPRMHEFAARVSVENAGASFQVLRLVGFCTLMKRAVIDKIGGFDERFGQGNFEDDDFCIRSGLAGFKLLVCNDVFIHHYGSRTFAGAKMDYRKMMRRNWKKFKDKWDLPDDRPMENGYRADEVLNRLFDVSWHYSPLPESPDDFASDMDPAFTEKRRFSFLVTPDWPGKQASLQTVLDAYLAAFKADDDVSLIILVEDVGDNEEMNLQSAENWLVEAIKAKGFEVDSIPDILLSRSPDSPRNRLALYKSVQAYIPTGELLEEVHRKELQACGCQAVEECMPFQLEKVAGIQPARQTAAS